MSRTDGTGEDAAGRGAAWLVELARVTALLGELHAATSRLTTRLHEQFGAAVPVHGATEVPDEAILALVRDRPRLTTTQLAARARCTVANARAAAARLVEAGRLERHGNGRGSYYTLPDTAETYGSSPEAEAQRISRVLALARTRAPLTSHDVHLELGLSPHHTRLLLARMVDQGVLARRGRRRGTTYVLPATAAPGTRGDGRRDGVAVRGVPGHNGDRGSHQPAATPRASTARVVPIPPKSGLVARAAPGGRASAVGGGAAHRGGLPPLPTVRGGLPPSISLESLLAAQEAERGGRRRDDDLDAEHDADDELDAERDDERDDDEAAAPLVETILTMFVDGVPRSAVEVAGELRLPYERVAGELATLVDGGMLEQRGRGKASKFVLSDT